VIVADVTDPAAIAAAVKEAVSARGPFDILVANAGGVATSPFAKTGADQFQRMFDLNVMGTIHCAQAVVGDMVARKFGRIIAVASTAGLKGYPYVSAYCTAKHAVVGLVRSLAIETAKTGVTVNAICPGYTDTDLVRESVASVSKKTGKSDDEIIAQYVKDMPIGRLIKPQEVAAAVLYLCSSDAASVTGTAMTVAGGEI
jgi:NAD(P)-dependent dehydrogenase (short-subunit alcohol dehydrogenase family)